jgi:phage replication-related protein YjqB (UPF0714/DUF867 family)
MLDTYSTVAEMLDREQRYIEIDTRVEGRSRIAVLAPHAGQIEPFTGEIARAVAGKDHRYYGFAGAAPGGSRRLHVTSTRFDEPALRSVLLGARTALSIHGTSGDDLSATLIGGINRDLAEAIRMNLERAGFAVLDAPARLAGADPRNVVNRVPEGGVQLELTSKQRQELRKGFLRRVRFDCYVQAIRAALAEHELCPGPSWDRLRIRSASPAA